MVTRLSYGLYQIFTQRSVRLGCLPSMSWGSRVCVLVPAHRGSQDSGAFGMGQKRGPILLVQQAWNFLLCLKVNEWDMNTEEGKTRQTPPISLFNQKLRLVTILVYLWTESHRIFAKRTILENSGCVLTRAAKHLSLCQQFFNLGKLLQGVVLENLWNIEANTLGK